MRNRFEIAPQAMLVSAGVIMSVVLISIMVSQFERAKALSSAVSERMIETTAQIADSDILQYDGATVTGADVRSFYRRCFSAVEPRSQFVNINNGNAVFKYDGPGHYADITDPEGANWMNLFIDSDCSRLSGWQGYDFLIGRTRENGDFSDPGDPEGIQRGG